MRSLGLSGLIRLLSVLELLGLLRLLRVVRQGCTPGMAWEVANWGSRVTRVIRIFFGLLGLLELSEEIIGGCDKLGRVRKIWSKWVD